MLPRIFSPAADMTHHSSTVVFCQPDQLSSNCVPLGLRKIELFAFREQRDQEQWQVWPSVERDHPIAAALPLTASCEPHFAGPARAGDRIAHVGTCCDAIDDPGTV